jgi:molybdopterin-guanine dinucleotide biosynthesis protein A
MNRVKTMKRGAIVLAGGRSRRMGCPKAWLAFGEETLLARMIRLLDPLVSCLVVVAAPKQELPPLPDHVIRTVDQRPGRGPLEGLCAGLKAGMERADVFYVSSCDVPLLKPAFVDRMFGLLQPGDEVVVPRDEHRYYPLSAVYHRDVLSAVLQLLSADQLRHSGLFERVKARIVDLQQLRDVDPQLDSLRNANTPADYQAALRDAGQSAR